ncbi:MAG: hypothetical protein LBE13_16205 [Bacteroidales bacterium]|jgi:TPR repeat protein|nr:hypothetical protein [Bacteroidales bacterium]
MTKPEILLRPQQSKEKIFLERTILLLCFFLLSTLLIAQNEDYNVSGDFYYKQEDYNKAIFHYSEGVDKKNAYASKKICSIFIEKIYHYKLNVELSYMGSIISINQSNQDKSKDYDMKNFFDLFEKMATEKDNDFAIYLLGYCYTNGDGVKKDIEKAKYYYDLLIRKKNPLAMREKALLISKIDLKKALDLLIESVKIQPSAITFLNISVIYYNNKHYKKAKEYAHKSLDLCKSGSAYYFLAACSGDSNAMNMREYDMGEKYFQLATEIDDANLLISEIQYVKSIFKF